MWEVKELTSEAVATAKWAALPCLCVPCATRHSQILYTSVGQMGIGSCDINAPFPEH